MATLYNRDIRVIAGPLTIAPRTTSGEAQPMLALTFKVDKDDGREPNKAKLNIWNLTATNRAKLQEKGLEVIIEAGYVDEIVQIFKGDIATSTITRDAVDWVTELELTDGGRQLKSARINESFRGGQPIGQMLKKAADALGLDAGNLAEKVASDGARSVLKELISSVVLSGSAADVVDKLAADMGLKFSVQDKQLTFLAKDEPLPGPAVKLSAGTGLIGSPSIGEKGIVKAKALLNGRIVPGRKVELESVVASGTYVARKVRHSGATWGSDWTTTLEMKAL
mgnify:CR=1 FL=1